MNDKQLMRYLEITKLIKQLEVEKEGLRAVILEADLAGVESEKFEIKVTTVTRSQVESLKLIKDKSTKLYNALMTAGCIREVESQRITITQR